MLSLSPPAQRPLDPPVVTIVFFPAYRDSSHTGTLYASQFPPEPLGRTAMEEVQPGLASDSGMLSFRIPQEI